MAFTKTQPFLDRDSEGRQIRTWKITGTTVGVADEVSIAADDGLVLPCEILLFESDLTTPGAASSHQPALGTIDTFTIGDLGELAQADAAQLFHRIQSNSDGDRILVTADKEKIVIRPAPDNTVTEMAIRLTTRTL